MAISPYITRLGPAAKLGFGDAAPTSGQWPTGSLVINTNPGESGPAGWICTEGGSPGTWRSIEAALPHYGILAIPVQLAQLANNSQILTNYVPGFAGSLVKAAFVVVTPATTSGKNATLSISIGGTNVTGGVVSLTSANCTPMGAVVNGSNITGNNTFTANSQITVSVSSTAQFAEGSGVYLLTFQG